MIAIMSFEEFMFIRCSLSATIDYPILTPTNCCTKRLILAN
jgi:hypothetical protein